MNENENQDLSMEDILSSIKGILEEDQEEKGAFVLEEKQEEIPDDIIDLSENQIISDLKPIEVDTVIDFDSDPIFDGELSDFMKPQAENVEAVAEIEENIDLVDEITNILEDAEQEKIATIANDTQEIAWEDVATEQVIEPEVETEDEMIEELIEPVPVIQPIVAESPVAKNNAVDTSAEIISNFARMFAQNKSAPVQPIIEKELKMSHTPTGDMSKTLEQMVLDVIDNEVSRINFSSAANQQVELLVKKWLDIHLPTTVEKIVKQELEEVMRRANQ